MFEKVIGIYGAPRSGTSWLGQIFDSVPDVKYQMHPFYSWAFRDILHPRSTKEEIDMYFKSVFDSNDNYLRQVDRRLAGVYPTWDEKSESPRFLAYKEVTTISLLPILLERASRFVSVVIVRNPYDALLSWYNDKKDCHEEWDFQNEWYFAQSRNALQADSYYGFHKWKEAINIFYEMEKAFPEQVICVSYEDLYENTETVVRNLFDKVGCDYTEQTKSFLWKSTHTSNPDTFSVFRDHQNSRKSGIESLPTNIRQIISTELQWLPAAKHFGYS